MAVTVTAKNYTLVNACAAATDWNGESPSDVSDFYKTGTSCVGFTIRDSTQVDVYLDAGTYDFSGTKHLRLWFMTTALKEMDLFANDGVMMYVTDGTNTAYWTVLGSDTYPGGWYPLVVDLSSTPTSGTKPTDMSACTSMGLRFNTTGAGKNFQNTWIDHVYLGDGLIAYGDDGGNPFDFDDILSADESTSNGWGLIRKISGVYYVNGSLTFGDNVSTNSCDFLDKSQTLVFEDRNVNSALYEIVAVGNGTGTTEFVLGASSGGKGISGCSVRTQSTAQTPKYKLTCTDTDVGTFQLYGCTFLDAGAVSFPLTGTNREVISSNFEVCGEIVVSTCKVQYCNVVSSDTRGIKISSTSHNVSDCNFIQCGHGIHFDTAGTYVLSNCQFSGSDGSSYYDTENSVVGTTCDSYSETNRDGDESLDDTVSKVGQSFTGDGGTLGHVYFVLSKSGTPTGNAVATIYAHTGTYGTNGVPTGAALATSKVFDVSTLDGTPTLIRFVFPVPSQVTLTNTTKYFVVIEYGDGTAANKVLVGRDGSSPSHGGNLASYTTVWAADNTKDGCFYVRVGAIVNISASNGSNPNQAYVDDTGSTEGTTVVTNTVALSIACKNAAGLDIPGVNIRIETKAGGTLIAEGSTDANGEYEYASYDYSSDVEVKIIARILGKKNNNAYDEITSSGLSVPFTMIRDPSVNLP